MVQRCVMDKRGNVAIKVLLILILIVIVSGITLTLVKVGVLAPGANQGEVLNTEFLPVGRDGSISITSFDFCRSVSLSYDCIQPTKIFAPEQQVHFRFVVESTVYEELIHLVESYQVRDPSGVVVLSTTTREALRVEGQSQDSVEQVSFRDYFVIGSDAVAGEYTLELTLENPLFGKEVSKIMRFTIE